MIAASPQRSVCLFPRIPYGTGSFIGHRSLFHKSVLFVIAQSSDSLRRCRTVPNGFSFGRKTPALKGRYKGPIITAEVVAITI